MRCKNCSAYNPDELTLKECMECGKPIECVPVENVHVGNSTLEDLPNLLASSSSSPQTKTDTAKIARSIKCLFCSTDNNPSFSHCWKCKHAFDGSGLLKEPIHVARVYNFGFSEWFSFISTHLFLMFVATVFLSNLENAIFATIAASIGSPVAFYVISLFFRKDAERFFITLMIYLSFCFLRQIILLNSNGFSPLVAFEISGLLALTNFLGTLGIRKLLKKIKPKKEMHYE